MIIAIWLSCAIPVANMIAPVWLLFSAIVLLVSRRQKLGALAVVAFSPFSFFFLLGAGAYFGDCARLRYSGGGHSPVHASIDPQCRCGYGGGFSFHWYGVEWIGDGAYNSAVRLLVWSLGPMKGSYVGPYPTIAEAIAALEQSQRISIPAFADDRLVVDNLTVRLDEGVGKRILQGARYSGFYDRTDILAELEQEYGPPTASIYKETCLILRLPRLGEVEPGSGPDALLVLIDTESGRPFAFYNEGAYHHLAMPVRWEKQRP